MNYQDTLKSFGDRVLVMGILNVTPDSFSDGGQFYCIDKAVDRAMKMLEDGADIIDIGGESTRPGSKTVPPEEEIERVVPVIRRLADRTGRPISIDTSKAPVAEAALKAGACIINDVSALRNDPAIGPLAAESRALLVLMHSRGTPETMTSLTDYGNLLQDIKVELTESVREAESMGVHREQIILDPGIGFAKTAEQNFEIIRGLHQLKAIGFPLLLGPSRKSFIGKVLDKPVSDRLMGTAAAVAACVINGADIVRVHDVKEMVDVVKIAERIKSPGK